MSKYTTLYLKCNSYDEFYMECEKAGVVDSKGIITTASHNHCMILIGVVMHCTDNMVKNDDGEMVMEMECVEGYHANLRYKEPIGIEHLAIDVSTPSVVFA